jgi:DmsE family decaheme c-type cytochrome
MNRTTVRRVSILGATGATLIVVGVVTGALLLPASAPAQKAPTEAPPATTQPATPPPAGAPPAPAALPEGYVGAETCKGCHQEQFEKFSRTKMGRLFLRQPRNSQEGLACENCHGPGGEHVAKGGGKGVGGMISFAKNDKTPVDKRNQMCLTCHNKGSHMFWRGSAHEARDVACTNCHKIMEDISPSKQLARPTDLETCGTCHIDKRAAAAKFSRHPMLEGKMGCTSCHNPHGSITPALLKEPSLNDTCFNCHAEKRGPFLWGHAPVVESCANCHDPHGSNHDKMLKLSRPRLCQQCHIESRHPTSPYGRDTGSLKFVMGRSCSSCHVQIHGSNHPSGHAFTR